MIVTPGGRSARLKLQKERREPWLG
jgi:hypothetical protein